jgi:RHS repeat-associated protein
VRQLTVRPQRLSPPLATEQDGGHPVRTYSETAFGGISADGCATYAYDGFDRMTSMTASGCGLSSATYTYDALDRMHTSTAGTVTHTFHYDGWNTTATTDVPSSGSTTTYELSPSDQPLGVTQASTSHNLFSDGHGNVSTAVTTSGSVACTARFDPFGNPLNVAGTVTPGTQQPDCNTGSTPDTVFYRNARHDSSSGDYPLGSRLYDPQKDSFLTQDNYRSGQPAANPNTGSDPLLLNTYTYVNGDPVNLSDPSGHRYTTGDDSTDANSGVLCRVCYTYPTHYAPGTTLREKRIDRFGALLQDEFVRVYLDWQDERASFYGMHAYNEAAHALDADPYDAGFFSSCHLESGVDVCPNSQGQYVLSGEELVLEKLPMPNLADLAIGAVGVIGFAACSASTGFIGTVACGAATGAAVNAAEQLVDTGHVDAGQVGVSALIGGGSAGAFGAASGVFNRVLNGAAARPFQFGDLPPDVLGEDGQVWKHHGSAGAERTGVGGDASPRDCAFSAESFVGAVG